jgi:hypothetical protein
MPWRPKNRNWHAVGMALEASSEKGFRSMRVHIDRRWLDGNVLDGNVIAFVVISLLILIAFAY